MPVYQKYRFFNSIRQIRRTVHSSDQWTSDARNSRDAQASRERSEGDVSLMLFTPSYPHSRPPRKSHREVPPRKHSHLRGDTTAPHRIHGAIK